MAYISIDKSYGTLPESTKPIKKTSTCHSSNLLTKVLTTLLILIGTAVGYYFVYYIPNAATLGANHQYEIEADHHEPDHTPSEATAYAHCDNHLTVFRKIGSADWVQVGIEDNWSTQFEYTTLATLSTRLRFVCEDAGVVGGFIASVHYEGEIYSTGDPIFAPWSISDYGGATGKYRRMEYQPRSAEPWKITSPGIAEDAQWVWNGMLHNTMTFDFDFTMLVDGSIGSAPTPKPAKTKKPRPTKGPKPTKKPKPTKAPKTKRPKPTKAPKPTKSSVSDAGLSCFSVEGTAVTAPSGFSRKDAICPWGIRTGCSAVYLGANDAYKGNWGVTASYNKWTPDADQGCAAGYYGEGKEDEFMVQARCCEDAAGVLGVAIKKGQTKAEVEVKFDDGSYCVGTLNEDLEKQEKMYFGCLVSADIEMDGSFGDSWSGSLDPGFGGVRRRPDGTCKGQTFSAAATDTCTGKDVDAGVDCMDSAKAILYLDEEDVVYMDSVKNDAQKTEEYKQTLIENAGFDLNADVEFKIATDETADWLKANCGGGYWAAWRDSQGWQLETISVPREVNGKKFECTIVDADWAVYNQAFGVYESVVGCAKKGGVDTYDHGALVDCSGYLDDQIDECVETKSSKQNYGSYYDGELCKARSSSTEIRAQAVCCTYQ